jgi:nucleolin
MDKKTGRSRGFGYLESADLITKDQYQEVVSSLTGVEVDGRPIKFDVTQSRPRQPFEGKKDFNRETKVMSPKENSVFVGNLDLDVNPKDVESIFTTALGAENVVNVRIAPPKDGTRFRFGHIDLINPDIAAKAIELLNNAPLNGKSILVAPAERKEDRMKREGMNPRQPGTFKPRQNYPSVYLGNLAWDLNLENIEDMLNDVLGPDQFITVRMAIDRDTGKQRGYAHIDFKDEESANRAVTELNGLEVLGRQLRADIAQRNAGGGGGGREGSFNRGPRKDRYENGAEGENIGNW